MYRTSGGRFQKLKPTTCQVCHCDLLICLVSQRATWIIVSLKNPMISPTRISHVTSITLSPIRRCAYRDPGFLSNAVPNGSEAAVSFAGGLLHRNLEPPWCVHGEMGLYNWWNVHEHLNSNA